MVCFVCAFRGWQEGRHGEGVSYGDDDDEDDDDDDDDDDDEDDRDEELAPLMEFGPQAQIVTNDLRSLDEMVSGLRFCLFKKKILFFHFLLRLNGGGRPGVSKAAAALFFLPYRWIASDRFRDSFVPGIPGIRGIWCVSSIW